MAERNLESATFLKKGKIGYEATAALKVNIFRYELKFLPNRNTAWTVAQK